MRRHPGTETRGQTTSEESFSARSTATACAVFPVPMSEASTAARYLRRARSSCCAASGWCGSNPVGSITGSIVTVGTVRFLPTSVAGWTTPVNLAQLESWRTTHQHTADKPPLPLQLTLSRPPAAKVREGNQEDYLLGSVDPIGIDFCSVTHRMTFITSMAPSSTGPSMGIILPFCGSKNNHWPSSR